MSHVSRIGEGHGTQEFLTGKLEGPSVKEIVSLSSKI